MSSLCFAGAEESPAEAMVAKAQQVAEAVKEHFQTLADSEVVQQARLVARRDNRGGAWGSQLEPRGS